MWYFVQRHRDMHRGRNSKPGGCLITRLFQNLWPQILVICLQYKIHISTMHSPCPLHAWRGCQAILSFYCWREYRWNIAASFSFAQTLKGCTLMNSADGLIVFLCYGSPFVASVAYYIHFIWYPPQNNLANTLMSNLADWIFWISNAFSAETLEALSDTNCHPPGYSAVW